ncbi:helix-turn-helix domain-containing protein [Streptomyces sp. AC536]|uniref:helix-turn-helix domain-containing protein n=1 Tax=Streptomyces buecherae TaxID=2763006 RepID=UPI00164E5AA1|nr:helix-turn-helix transcriptional regulator [Streptomyces buecherae]MBC3985630.1 helix-turn-helix domain-containing protein [Streptomyces buecherae]QNJ42395.1 helix-turn-helix domain-containing protein [Streptomyces buecherae]
MELHEDDHKTTPRALIGRQLRRRRTAGNLSQRALADAIGYPGSYISRVERDEQLPSEALARALDEHFGTLGLFADLRSMAEEALVAAYSQNFIDQESRAARIEVFTSSIIPGLLQTKDYARELLRTSLPTDLANEVDLRVQSRLERQKMFERDAPPFFWAIFDEAALRRSVASKSVMANQMKRLLQYAQEPYTEVQVLPFDGGLHPFPGGSVTLLTMKDGSRKTSLVESFGTGVVIDTPRDLVDLEQRFDKARAQALPQPASLALIRTYLKEYER